MNLDLAQFDGHLPGPWFYSKKYDWGEVRTKDGALICQVRDTRRVEHSSLEVYRRNDTDPWKETASIVAAAPQLLAELKAERERLSVTEGLREHAVLQQQALETEIKRLRTFVEECATDDLDRISPGLKEMANIVLSPASKKEVGK